MKYKIISTDFDGTLLTSNKIVSDRTNNILLKLKKEGYIIVGITARNLASVRGVCDIKIFDYLILNNGTYIYNVNENVGKYIGYLNKNDAKEITKYFEKSCKYIDYCAVEKYYKYKGDATTRTYYESINSLVDIEDIVARMNIFFYSNDKIADYIKYIRENFKRVDSFTMQDTDNGNDGKWIVINPKGVNKFSGLKKLCDELQIEIDSVIFFGDSGNDLEIIKNVGLGVAMENALDNVKENAKKVTLTNDEDGVAVFLENLIFERKDL